MNRELEKKLTNLKNWNRAALVAEWLRLNGKPPPRNTSPQFMSRVITYHWQEEAYGGLPRKIEQQITMLIRQHKQSSDKSITPQTQMKSGTTLRRLWQGKIYEVSAASDGFMHNGRSYKSLSEVARTITGTRWNGHVFFGLKRKTKAELIEAAK